MNNLERMIEIAKDAHFGQKRWDGTPYINHPLAVSDMVEGTVAKIVAVAHDLFEDTKVRPEDLKASGFSPGIIDMIDCLTKRDDEEYIDYLARLTRYDTCVYVKIADIKHNMSDLKREKHKNMHDKYTLALFLLSNEESVDLLRTRAYDNALKNEQK